MIKLLAVALVLTLGVACNGSASRATSVPPSTSAAGSACARAWQDFAAIDDFHDRMRAAVPTLRACQSLEEWIQVGRATPGHRLLTTRITALRMCRYEKEIRTASVCRSLRQRSEPKALEAAGALDATQDLPGLVATP